METTGQNPIRFIEDDNEKFIQLEVSADFLKRLPKWKTKLAHTDLEKKLRLGLFKEAMKRGYI